MATICPYATAWEISARWHLASAERGFDGNAVVKLLHSIITIADNADLAVSAIEAVAVDEALPISFNAVTFCLEAFQKLSHVLSNSSCLNTSRYWM